MKINFRKRISNLYNFSKSSIDAYNLDLRKYGHVNGEKPNNRLLKLLVDNGIDMVKSGSYMTKDEIADKFNCTIEEVAFVEQNFEAAVKDVYNKDLNEVLNFSMSEYDLYEFIDKSAEKSGFYKKYLLLEINYRDLCNDREGINLGKFTDLAGGDANVYIVPKSFKDSKYYDRMLDIQRYQLDRLNLEKSLSHGYQSVSPDELPSDLNYKLDHWRDSAYIYGYYNDDELDDHEYEIKNDIVFDYINQSGADDTEVFLDRIHNELDDYMKTCTDKFCKDSYYNDENGWNFIRHVLIKYPEIDNIVKSNFSKKFRRSNHSLIFDIELNKLDDSWILIDEDSDRSPRYKIIDNILVLAEDAGSGILLRLIIGTGVEFKKLLRILVNDPTNLLKDFNVFENRNYHLTADDVINITKLLED